MGPSNLISTAMTGTVAIIGTGILIPAPTALAVMKAVRMAVVCTEEEEAHMAAAVGMAEEADMAKDDANRGAGPCLRSRTRPLSAHPKV